MTDQARATVPDPVSPQSDAGEAARAFLDGKVTLHAGDCRDVIATLPDCSVDAIVTDPPYALVSIGKRFGKPGSAPARDGDVYARASAGFMGQQWDTGETAFAAAFWAQCLRVLKPGGHVIAFAGTRTYHRLACAVEDAGFEIRDMIAELVSLDPAIAAFLASLDDAQRAAFARIMEESAFGGMVAWVYGQGFPKSHDAAKAIDRHFGKEGETVPTGAPVKRMIPGADQHKSGWEKTNGREYQPGDYVPATPEAAQWRGWGTALKPAIEPCVFARKPLDSSVGGTVAATMLAHGTGGLNIDGCLVGATGGTKRSGQAEYPRKADGTEDRSQSWARTGHEIVTKNTGRFPANVIHDGSAEVVERFPQTASGTGAVKRASASDAGGNRGAAFGAEGRPAGTPMRAIGDSGSAARFFYTAKASADDRIGSKHPTVKPVDLMRYMVRLVTPPGGVVLDPFAGTGTTGEAAYREGMRAVLIEREETYRADIARRMDLVLAGPRERKQESVKARGRVDDAGPLFGGLDTTDRPAGGGERSTDTTPTRTNDRPGGAQTMNGTDT